MKTSKIQQLQDDAVKSIAHLKNKLKMGHTEHPIKIVTMIQIANDVKALSTELLKARGKQTNVYEKHKSFTFSLKAIEKKLAKSDFFKSLNFALNKYLEKNLLVEYDR